MHGVLVLAIIFGGTVLALAIIGSTILMAIKIIKGGFSRKNQQKMTDEARMVQEIYQGLERIEERVESLETIILEEQRKEYKSDAKI